MHVRMHAHHWAWDERKKRRDARFVVPDRG